jgi:dTDP-4-amino-4,6-dideoxygalactose transaminase
MSDTPRLALHGGPPVRKDPMPPRFALAEAETKMIDEALAYYRAQGLDPGYQGHFEKHYTDAFVSMMDGGYADAVATGTSALFIAIAALELPEGSEILVSPITDPGALAAIILNRHRPRLMDSRPGSFNADAEQFLARVTPATRAVLVTHSLGRACDVEPIARAARERGIRTVEDCSQSHGATVGARLIGTFGDIAAFSTMYRKAHMTGATGGLVYSRDVEVFHRALAYADRGKPRWREDFDDRDPNTFLFPALNHHSNEISCAVGLASLSRLHDTIVRRLSFVSELTARMLEECALCRPYGYLPGDSPFVYPLLVDPEAIGGDKTEFARAVLAEGIGLNPHYQYLVADWPYLKPYLADDFATPNARAIRDRSFMLYLNENYGDREVTDVVAAIRMVERHYSRGA